MIFKSLLQSALEDISVYLHDENYEYSIIRVVGGLKMFLNGFRDIGFIQETHFVKAVREFLKNKISS